MIREYIQFIGLISQTKVGLGWLKDYKIFIPLRTLVRAKTKDGKRDHVLSVLLFSLDYKHR